MPVFSVIIPFHDRADELPQTLASVAAQTFGDFEAVIVNDRSSDAARAAAAQAIAALDSRFRLIDLPANQSGAPAARNFGLARTSGKFVIFLDSDDLLSSDCLEHRAAFLDQHPEVDYSISRCRLFSRRENDIGLLWNHDTNEDDLDRLLRMDVPWQTTSPTWRRDALARIVPPIDRTGSPWDESVLSGQDWEFHIRAVLSPLKYARLDRVDCHWRVASGERESIGKSSFRKQHLLHRPQVLEKMIRTLAAANRLDARNRLLLDALFFHAADAIARRVDRRLARQVWRQARELGLTPLSRFVEGWKHLLLSRTPHQRARGLARLQKRWPKEYIVAHSRWFNKTPIDGCPPVVSVIVSTYNYADYLRESIDSILNQSFRDFELIIINDGSKDDTEAVLKTYTDADCRVRVVNRGNKGLAISLNEGIDLARGRYLARMDADDIAYPDRFDRQVRFLDAHPEVVCVGTQVRLIDPFGSPLDIPPRALEHEQIDAELITGFGWAMVHPSVMMRADAVRRVGAYRPEYNMVEDLDLFQRLGEVGRLANLDELLLDYRQHLASVNKTKLHRQMELSRQLLAEVTVRRGLSDALESRVEPRVPVPPHRQHLIWGWRALKQGNVEAARRHGGKVVRMNPFHQESWRLWAASLRGR